MAWQKKLLPNGRDCDRVHVWGTFRGSLFNRSVAREAVAEGSRACAACWGGLQACASTSAPSPLTPSHRNAHPQTRAHTVEELMAANGQEPMKVVRLLDKYFPKVRQRRL